MVCDSLWGVSNARSGPEMELPGEPSKKQPQDICERPGRMASIYRGPTSSREDTIKESSVMFNVTAAKVAL